MSDQIEKYKAEIRDNLRVRINTAKATKFDWLDRIGEAVEGIRDAEKRIEKLTNELNELDGKEDI